MNISTGDGPLLLVRNDSCKSGTGDINLRFCLSSRKTSCTFLTHVGGHALFYRHCYHNVCLKGGPQQCFVSLTFFSMEWCRKVFSETSLLLLWFYGIPCLPSIKCIDPNSLPTLILHSTLTVITSRVDLQ